MSNANIAQSDQINNHELTKFIQNSVNLLKLSIVQGLNGTMNPSVYNFQPKTIEIGGQNPVTIPSVAQVVAEKIRTFDPSKINGLRVNLGRDTSITKSIRSMGVDMRSGKSVIDQLDLKNHFAFVNDTTFNDGSMQKMLSSLSVIKDVPSPMSSRDALMTDLHAINARYAGFLPSNWVEGVIGSSSTTVHAVINKGVKFRIHEVKCIDETNPEWLGSDEIAWGGSAVSDKGTASRIPEKRVGGGFDDGDRKTYSPPEIVKNFLLDNQYPKEFLIVLTLAEKDSGGLSDFIRKLYDAIKGEIALILKALGTAAGAAIGAAIGGSVGTAIGGPLGTIIGVVAGAILGEIVNWLASLFADDIFTPQSSSLFLQSAQDTFPGGGLVSPRMALHYRDHGGHYRVMYDWEITR